MFPYFRHMSPTMRYSAGTRSTILGSFVSFIIVTIWWNHSLEPTSLPVPIRVSDPAACRVWPDWKDSSQTEECDSTFRSLVGDSAFISNSDSGRCLSASPRFNQYSSPDRDWSKVRWGQVQKRCRAESQTSQTSMQDIWRQRYDPRQAAKTHASSSGAKTNRTVVVLRTWDDYKYTEKRRVWLRTLITELSLQVENGYDVFFLVNVKDGTSNIDLQGSKADYEQMLQRTVPEEFREMAFLFNTKILENWYPKVNEHGAQDQMYQALQIFSQKFPQYDYIWQLEMDLRFTAHIHETLESMSGFARKQSRRNLWERNGCFYIPELYDHSYQAFVDAVDDEIGDKGVWGPVQTNGFVPQGPKPPSRSKHDWGVGEDAELISFMPMVDPKGTDWVYEDYVTGFVDGVSTPRRVAIVSITRASRHLLQLVHEAQRDGQWVVSEATLETFSLLHGLKAVSIPHPISFASDITAEQLDSQIHKGPAYSKAGGSEPLFFYTKTHGFLNGPWWVASYFFTGDGPKGFWEAYIGGRVLPPMLIHPVKEE